MEAVRHGDDLAFEELYRRYQPRIAAYVRRMVNDPARAEDVAQDAFFSALRRMRVTDAEIAFKPWIFEIARNAAIDHWRRSTRAEEVSVEADDQLRKSDRGRLVGSAGPHSALAEKERFEHLRSAFDELSDTHSRILIMRELEGLSYREIAERLHLSRGSVESALFRARRRLESEYADISQGRRCAAMRTVIARLAEGLKDRRDEARLARHARRCHVCRRRARELGLEPLAPLGRLRRKAAALLPFPLLPRGGDAAARGAGSGGQDAGTLLGLLPGGAQAGAMVAERAAALAAGVALAGAGSIALGGDEVPGGERQGTRPAAVEQRAPEPWGAAAAVADRPERVDGDGDRRARGDAAGESGRNAGTGLSAQQAGGSETSDAGGPGDGDASPAPTESGGGQGAARNGGGNSHLPGTGLGHPRLPAVPEVGGGMPSGPSGGGVRLPDLPAPPSVKAPSAPDVSPPPPRAEARSALPVDVPAAPQLPPVEPGMGLEDLTANGAG